jgi:prefoldin subunit 5
MKVQKSVAEVNAEIHKLGQRIEALRAGIGRLEGDRDYHFQKRTLEEMLAEHEKRHTYLKSAICNIQVEIEK